jgi:hypothetical protein
MTPVMRSPFFISTWSAKTGLTTIATNTIPKQQILKYPMLHLSSLNNLGDALYFSTFQH